MTDTSNTNSASTTDPTTAVDVQDPLPESDWFWRRAFSYVATLLLLAGIGWTLYGLEAARDSAGLLEMGLRLCWLVALVSTFYMIAPSAEQIARIIQAASILKSGASITRTARAETPEGTKTEVTTSAGTPTSAIAPAAPQAAPEADSEDYAPRGRS
jgi:hypothetical protein